MCGFFQEQGYRSDLLCEDLRKISSINRHDTTYSHREENSQVGRVPLVLTYHPLNEKTKRIVFDNFQILNNDPEIGRIFTDGPLVAYCRDAALETCWFTPPLEVKLQIPQVPFFATIHDAVLVNMLTPQ